MRQRNTLRAPSEKEVQRGIVRTLRTLGAAIWDTSQPRRAKITPGLPDLLIFHGGRFVFVEVKGPPGGKLTDGQRTFQAECEAAGVDFRVWTSSEDAVAWVQEEIAP